MAPRRSRRLASKEPEKIQLPTDQTWSVEAAVTRVLNGERKYIKSLTKGKLEAMINSLAENELESRGRIHELEAHNKQLQEQIKNMREQENRRVYQRVETMRKIQTEVEENRNKAAAEAKAEAERAEQAVKAKNQITQLPPRSSQIAPTPSTPLAPVTSAFSKEQVETVEMSAPPHRTAEEIAPSPWKRTVSTIAEFLTPWVGQKRRAPAPSFDATPVSSKPSPMSSKPSPRTYAGPSTKYPGMPTSLSTIDEWTEPSLMSEPATTPSKPPPRRERRSVTQIRAARAAGRHTPAPSPTPTPRPASLISESRLEKFRHLKALEKEVEELRKDEDVLELQQHRRKRVKVDDLVTIPHNLPGDPEGCFRVPDIDSDSEIEVDIDAPLKSNVFKDDASLTNAATSAEPNVNINDMTFNASMHEPEDRTSSTSAVPNVDINDMTSNASMHEPEDRTSSTSSKVTESAIGDNATSSDAPATMPPPRAPDSPINTFVSRIMAEQNQQEPTRLTSATATFVHYEFPIVGEKTDPLPHDVSDKAAQSFVHGYEQWRKSEVAYARAESEAVTPSRERVS